MAHVPAQQAPLSPVEGLFWGIEENSVGAFRVTVVVWLDGCLEAGLLNAALDRLQRRHPKLRAVVAEDEHGGRHYRFDRPVGPIPFQITDCDVAELPWREETRRLLRAPFPAGGPVAVVAVLRNRARASSVLLLTVHHAIADGLSAIMLVDDLLTEYENVEASLDTPPRPALPAVTAARATTPRGWRSRMWLLRRFLRLQRAERRSRQTSLPEAQDVPPQSQWVHWIFTPAQTRALVRRCRKEEASLGGVQVAAVCSGLMDCLPGSDAVFKCQFPFDLRETLEGSTGPISPQDLGCFVSIMNEFYEVSRDVPFWELARRAHRNVEAFVQHGGPSFYYNLAALAAGRFGRRAAPRVVASSDKRVTLLATNYGVLAMRDAYGTLRARACTLVFKNDRVGPSLVMEALVLGQQLNIGFAADGLEPAFWERLQAAVRRHLERAADTGTSTP